MIATGDGIHDITILILQDVLLILSVVVAGIAVFKFPLKKWQTWLHKQRDEQRDLNIAVNEIIPKLLEGHNSFEKSLEFILSELKPNHGTSIKDSINRIEEKVNLLDGMLRGWWSQDAKPMFITDEKGDMVWCNASYTDITNRDTSELYGRGYFNIIEHTQLEGIRQEASSALKDRRDMILYFNVSTGDPKQPLIPVESTSVPILGKNGELKGYIGTLKRLDNHYGQPNNLDAAKQKEK